MGEKMNVDQISSEMDVLWGRIKELEMVLARKLGNTLKNTTGKLKQQLAAEPSRRFGDLVVSNELRNELIRLTAYYKAEAHGFVPGEEVINWLEAEEEVNRLLLEGGASLATAETAGKSESKTKISSKSKSTGKAAAPRKTAGKPDTLRT